MVLITYYVLYITTLIIRKINSIELYTRTKTKEKPKMQTQVTQSAQDNLPITKISPNQNKNTTCSSRNMEQYRKNGVFIK